MSIRAMKGLAAAAMTFGLGTLLAVPLLLIARVIADGSDAAELVAIAAAIAYPVAAGYLFFRDERAPAVAPRRRPRPQPPAPEPVDVRFVDEVLDHDHLLAGFRAMRARSAEHRLRAMRGKETDAFATGYETALHDLSLGIVRALEDEPTVQAGEQ